MGSCGSSLRLSPASCQRNTPALAHAVVSAVFGAPACVATHLIQELLLHSAALSGTRLGPHWRLPFPGSLPAWFKQTPANSSSSRVKGHGHTHQPCLRLAHSRWTETARLSGWWTKPWCSLAVEISDLGPVQQNMWYVVQAAPLISCAHYTRPAPPLQMRSRTLVARD